METNSYTSWAWSKTPEMRTQCWGCSLSLLSLNTVLRDVTKSPLLAEILPPLHKHIPSVLADDAVLVSTGDQTHQGGL